MIKVAHIYPRCPRVKGGILHYAGILERELAAFAEILPFPREDLSWSSARALAREIRERGCNAAILQYTPNLYGWRNPFPCLLLARLRRMKIPVLTVFHEIFMPDYRTLAGKLMMRPVNYLKDRACLSATSVPVVTFGWRAGMIRRRFGVDCHMLPVFSNVPPYEGPVLPKTHLLGFFGTLHHDFRREALLSAAQTLGVRALLIGDIPEDAALRRGADMTGHLPPWEASHVLQSVKYFVLCDCRGVSFRKGSTAAAFMSGLPVLANRTDWTDPEFSHGENVFFHDGSADGIVQAVETLEARPDLAARIGEGGRALYRERMEPRKIAEQMMRLLGSRVCA
jgi:glycosyltransferase involved in cell wall biosynthesis